MCMYPKYNKIKLKLSNFHIWAYYANQMVQKGNLTNAELPKAEYYPIWNKAELPKAEYYPILE